MPIITRRDAIIGAAKLGLITVLTPQALAQQAPEKATGRITLVLVNDLDRMGADAGRGGHAKLATVAKAERAKGNTLLIHAGDAISPSLLAGIDKGYHIIDLLNRIAPDLFTPGNHEFDFGPENFRERMKQARFEIISSNIHEKNGAPVAGLNSAKIVEIGGFRLGFLGVTTEQTLTLASPGDIGFKPAVQAARDEAAALRGQGAELIVAITHVGFGDDLALVHSGAVDVILSGHDHHLITYWDGKVVLLESASQANFVTPVDLLIERTVKDGAAQLSFVPNLRPIDTLDIEPDPEIADIVKGYEAQIDKELDVAIGTTETAFDTRRGSLRAGENAFGNLVCDAMRAETAADICITNSGGIRGNRDYAAGTVLTRKTVLEELPFGNRTVVLEITGKLLRDALENGFAGDGRFPQVSGLTAAADMTRPSGSRITDIAIGGRPLDDKALYKLATNDYLARGGDGYEAFKQAKVLVDPLAGQYVAGQVIGYISRQAKLAPKTEGRLVLTR